MIPSATESITTGANQTAGAPTQELGRDAFLNLLITQLQNQDPLDPTDSVEFTAQLAQFSSLEQLGNVNDNLKLLQNFQASINNSQAVALIGKEITASGNSLQYTGDQPAGCRFNLDSDAALVVVSIYDQTGGYVKSFEALNIAAGHQTLYWDGTDHNGNAAASGSYTFEVQAVDANGRSIKATTFFNGNANKVIFENNTTFVIVGGQKVALGEIVEVGVVETTN